MLLKSFPNLSWKSAFLDKCHTPYFNKNSDRFPPRWKVKDFRTGDGSARRLWGRTDGMRRELSGEVRVGWWCCGVLPRLSKKPKCSDFKKYTYSKINYLCVRKHPF